MQLYPNWKDVVTYSPGGPQPRPLLEDEKVKMIVAGMLAGQMIPSHPEALGIYYILDGQGWMTVDQEKIRVEAGTTVIAPAGSSRGFQAETDLAFFATRVA